MEKTVCLQFCSYYKPGRNEELCCGGYLAIDRLLQEGRRMAVGPSGSVCGAEERERIVEAICTACSFREDGCDFIVDRAAPPCGGFRMLSRLVADRVLRVDEL